MASTGSGTDHRAGYLAGGALVGIVLGALVWSYGATRLQTIGVFIAAIGLALWFGSMVARDQARVVDERTRRQRYRSRAIGLGLGALVVIFYVATLVRLGPNAIKRDGFVELNAKKNMIIEGDSACKRAGTC